MCVGLERSCCAGGIFGLQPLGEQPHVLHVLKTAGIGLPDLEHWQPWACGAWPGLKTKNNRSLAGGCFSAGIAVHCSLVHPIHRSIHRPQSPHRARDVSVCDM